MTGNLVPLIGGIPTGAIELFIVLMLLVFFVSKIPSSSSTSSKQKIREDDISDVVGYADLTRGLENHLHDLVDNIENVGSYHRIVESNKIEFRSIDNQNTHARIEITPERSIKILCINGEGQLVDPLEGDNISPTTRPDTIRTVIEDQVPAILKNN